MKPNTFSQMWHFHSSAFPYQKGKIPPKHMFYRIIMLTQIIQLSYLWLTQLDTSELDSPWLLPCWVFLFLKVIGQQVRNLGHKNVSRGEYVNSKIGEVREKKLKLELSQSLNHVGLMTKRVRNKQSWRKLIMGLGKPLWFLAKVHGWQDQWKVDDGFLDRRHESTNLINLALYLEMALKSILPFFKK